MKMTAKKCKTSLAAGKRIGIEQKENIGQKAGPFKIASETSYSELQHKWLSWVGEPNGLFVADLSYSPRP